ncbi:uncharacterized protein [Palaemon carinicauda]|uniref:uncharacterized protein n=1 Tax=Palaemon carinicauda TaxID=392227 RepID=UPI0035B62C50
MERIYLSRREGGLGLTKINQAYKEAIVSIGQYLEISEDENIKKVAQYHNEALSQQTSITKQAKNFAGELLEETMGTEQTPAAMIAKKTSYKFSSREEKLRMERWKHHGRAGRFQGELGKGYIDKEESHIWLKNGNLGFDGKKMIVGAQAQGLLTNGFKKMTGISGNDQCGFCYTAVEIVGHVVSACHTLLADGQYTARHNMIYKYTYWKICKECNIEVKDKIWEHEPDPVTSNRCITIFYDKIILTGGDIGGAIKPDNVICNE